MVSRVFVTRRIPEPALLRLRQSCDVILRDVPMPPNQHELITGIQNCDGLLCLLTDPVTAGVLASNSRLRVVSTMAVGYDNIDIAAATRLGIAVGNTPGVLTEATADLTVALMLAAARCFKVGLHDVESANWRTWEPVKYLGQELSGKTLGIIGMGRIGSAVARRCHFGWGMNVLYCGPNAIPKVETELSAKRVDLETLLENSDFVSLHCPLSPTTRGMMGHAEFRQMKPTAVFVNTARGGLVDESALHHALSESWIFAAGLDVTNPEPPIADTPMLRLPNLIVLPHIASATVETRNRMAEMAVDNLLAGLADQVLPNPVVWTGP